MLSLSEIEHDGGGLRKQRPTQTSNRLKFHSFIHSCNGTTNSTNGILIYFYRHKSLRGLHKFQLVIETITIFFIQFCTANPTPIVYFFFLFISSFLFMFPAVCFRHSSSISTFFVSLPFLSTPTIYCTNSTDDHGVSIPFSLRHYNISAWHKIHKLKSSSNRGKEQHYYCRSKSSFSKHIIPNWCFSLFSQFRQIICLSLKSSAAT